MGKANVGPALIEYQRGEPIPEWCQRARRTRRLLIAKLFAVATFESNGPRWAAQWSDLATVEVAPAGRWWCRSKLARLNAPARDGDEAMVLRARAAVVDAFLRHFP